MRNYRKTVATSAISAISHPQMADMAGMAAKFQKKIMNEHRFILQPYCGVRSRHTCPACHLLLELLSVERYATATEMLLSTSNNLNNEKWK